MNDRHISRLRDPELGLGAHMGLSGGGRFDPQILFADGEQGVIFLPSPQSCFKDTERTIPAAVGDAVAGMTDLSGNGNHAFQPTIAARPILRAAPNGYYLEFDGVDDRMVTNSINLTGTDEITLFAGQRKLAGIVSFGAIVETDNSSGNGTFLLAADNGTIEYTGRSKGTVLSDANADSVAYASPHSAVLTFNGDISHDIATLRINGVQAASSTINQGNGSYGNYPMDIGARSSGGRYAGHIYGLIVRGRVTQSEVIGRVEAFLRARVGITN